jgi:hypothetical protein
LFQEKYGNPDCKQTRSENFCFNLAVLWLGIIGTAEPNVCLMVAIWNQFQENGNKPLPTLFDTRSKWRITFYADDTDLYHLHTFRLLHTSEMVFLQV